MKRINVIPTLIKDFLLGCFERMRIAVVPVDPLATGCYLITMLGNNEVLQAKFIEQ